MSDELDLLGNTICASHFSNLNFDTRDILKVYVGGQS